METKESGHISEKELDGLLNQAFLNLDFDNNLRNKEVLSVVSRHVMHKKSTSVFFTVRFNFLFLLLSFSMCVTSFYRYITSLPDQVHQQINSAPVSKVAENKASAAQAANVHVESNPGKIHAKPAQVSSRPLTKYSVKSKKNRSEQKKKKQIPENIAVSSPENVTVDSAIIHAAPAPEQRGTDSTITENSAESLNNTLQKKAPVVSPITGNTQARSSRKLKPLKQENKTKVAKRRKGRHLFRNGTFKMKNRKYGKSLK